LREFGRKRDGSDVQRSLDLAELVRQAIELTRPRWQGQAQAQARTIEVETDLQPVPRIMGEEPALRELLTNLIFNAVDAMPSGGKISFSTAAEGGVVVLRVKDTGTGMTEEVRRRCLEPFYTTKGEQGTGLGLSMVHGIVQRHEGALEIESEPGRGSVFSIRLPVQPAGEVETPEDEVPAWPEPLRILAVDDEPLHCALLEAHLSGDGHFVETASDATTAVEIFETKPFDLVITDQAMPGMSGEHLAAVLRSMLPSQRIVLVTGFGDLMMVSGEPSRHINLILSKPFTQRSLRAAVAAAMSGENLGVEVPQHELGD
jgi:CheY-like chemotaxis protein/anti-sigma regulatory factor (Ser/Thr protein kinase)